MIVEKNRAPFEAISEEEQQVISQVSGINLKSMTVEEAVKVNALCEMYLAIRSIIEDIRVDDDNPNSPRIFNTVKLDTGQLSRIKNNKWNQEYGIAFPAVFIHFVNVYYLVGASNVNEGRGTCRIHFVLNRLNNEDDVFEQDGFKVYQKIVQAITAHKGEFPALVNRFQLAYFDQPLTFDDGLQPYWIDYEVYFSDYTSYRYKDYVERYVVMPPFTDHSDQLPASNTEGHTDHHDPTIETAAGIQIPQ